MDNNIICTAKSWIENEDFDSPLIGQGADIMQGLLDVIAEQPSGICEICQTKTMQLLDESRQRITELEQALNGLRSDYDLNNCRANTYQQALEQIENQPEEGWMGAMECQLIACEALARSDKATALRRG